MAKASAKKNKSTFSSVFLKKLLENYLSVLPIVIVVTTLYIVSIFVDGFLPKLNLMTFMAFLICAIIIGLGLSFFTLGTDESMSRIGTLIGESLFKKKRIFFVVSMTFLLGVMITVAEPDLSVMAEQIGWNKYLLIAFVALGVGLFVVFGVLRIVFNKNLNIMFICFYAIVFMLAGLVNPKFLPIAFDSGGVTTGPVTVPFILAFGAGLAASKSTNGRSGEDAFGLTALASVGPIICVMAMALFADADSLVYTMDANVFADVTEWSDFAAVFFTELGSLTLHELQNVAISIAPVTVFFLIYNFIFIRLRPKQLIKILVNLFYAYIGLVAFLTAVNLGFLPMAQTVGEGLGNDQFFAIAVLVGALFGLFGVLAEPAVHVLVRQIETISEGTIKSKTVLAVMALAIGGGVALAIVRSYFDFSILYIMVPGYMLALGLSFLVPKIYTSIAFDSGGVASGPMASTFVMPFAIGFTVGKHGTEYVYTDAFGCVAMIALMPLIVIQLMGLYAQIKRAIINSRIRKQFIDPDDNELVFFGEVEA